MKSSCDDSTRNHDTSDWRRIDVRGFGRTRIDVVKTPSARIARAEVREILVDEPCSRHFLAPVPVCCYPDDIDHRPRSLLPVTREQGHRVWICNY